MVRTPGQRKKRRRLRRRKAGHTCEKIAYRSPDMATKAAAAILIRTTRLLEPYDCRACGFWHLRTTTKAGAPS